jgi:thiol-disulfide isomerase/thioredoxin
VIRLNRKVIGKWVRDLLILVVLISALGWYQTRNLTPGATPVTGEMRVVDWAGNSHSLKALAAERPALLYFWAPWCGVCKISIQNAVTAAGWAGGVKVMLIALDYESRQEVEEFVQSQGLDSKHVFLGDADLQQKLIVHAYPTMYLVSHGQIQASSVGYSTTIGTWLRLLFLV